jgi:hypothetical protein
MSDGKQSNNLLKFVWKYFSSNNDDMIVVRKSMIDICDGDFNSAMMISHLIYWHEKFNDMDRWIKISYQEWYDQCRLTERKLKNALKNLKKIGFVEIKVKKFNKAPCLHFKVDFTLLTDALNKYIEDDPRNGRNVQIRNGRNVQIHEMDETSESITENYTEQSVEIVSKIAPGPENQAPVKELPRASACPPPQELLELFKTYKIESPKRIGSKTRLLIEKAVTLLSSYGKTLEFYLNYLDNKCGKWLHTPYMIGGKEKENNIFVILRLDIVALAIEGEYEDEECQ